MSLLDLQPATNVVVTEISSMAPQLAHIATTLGVIAFGVYTVRSLASGRKLTPAHAATGKGGTRAQAVLNGNGSRGVGPRWGGGRSRVFNPAEQLLATGDAAWIDRRTKYGNPYVIGRDGGREEVIAKYRVWLFAKLKQDPDFLEDLQGKDLVCHCAPKACHGDVIEAAIAWRYSPEGEAWAAGIRGEVPGGGVIGGTILANDPAEKRRLALEMGYKPAPTLEEIRARRERVDWARHELRERGMTLKHYGPGEREEADRYPTLEEFHETQGSGMDAVYNHPDPVMEPRPSRPHRRRRVVIAGSRNMAAGPFMEHAIRGLGEEDVIVTGGTWGFDQEAARTARRLGRSTAVVPTDVRKHGRRATAARTREMVEGADELIAFHDFAGHDTTHAIRTARARGIPLTIYTPTGVEIGYEEWEERMREKVDDRELGRRRDLGQYSYADAHRKRREAEREQER